MLTAKPTLRAPFSGPIHRAVAACASRSSDVCRRDLLALLAVVPAVAAAPALALIPDDDDEELVQKAKANRAERLTKVRRAIARPGGRRCAAPPSARSPVPPAARPGVAAAPTRRNPRSAQRLSLRARIAHGRTDLSRALLVALPARRRTHAVPAHLRRRPLNRLPQDKEANREYLQSSGYRDRSIETAIVPVQTGVYKLAQAGEQLESGDLSAASATLGEAWLSDFETGCSTLSISDDSKQLVPAMVSSIRDVASAASAGDVNKAKVRFVELVESVEKWAVGAGVNGSIKGL